MKKARILFYTYRKSGKVAYGLRKTKSASIKVVQHKNESSPTDCFFVFGCNEAHLRCMKNEAELRPVKRAFGSRKSYTRFASWRQRRRFMEAARLLLHIRIANASLTNTWFYDIIISTNNHKTPGLSAFLRYHVCYQPKGARK